MRIRAFAILFFLALNLNAQEYLRIQVAEVQAVIDGQIDEVWKNTTSVKLEKEIITTGIEGDEDFSCSFRSMWDQTGFYLLLEVKDDILYNTDADTYKNDNIEVYFDINNSKNALEPPDAAWPETSFDDDDFQIRFNWNSDSIEIFRGQFESVDPTPIVLAQSTTSDGYIIEAYIPWYALGYLNINSGTAIGFDLLASDNDGDETGRNEIAWHTESENIWHDASLMGTILLDGDAINIDIINIDGIEDNVWSIVEELPLTKEIAFVNVTSPEDFSASFKTLWDSIGLYLLLKVKDDIIVNTAEAEWENDNLEFYIDLDNSKNSSTIGFDSNDKQFRFIAGVTEDFNGTGIDYQFLSNEGGYNMEVFIPWRTIEPGFVPITGNKIGIELLLSDSDDGNRDAMAWNTSSYDVWKEPGLWGTMKFNHKGYLEVFDLVSQGAKKYFVSPGGNDQNHGLSENYPFLSPQKAANLTFPGDTVVFMNGTFYTTAQFLNINRSGEESKPIVYKAQEGASVKIKVSGSVWETVLINANHIVFEEIELEGDLQNLTLTDAEAAMADRKAGGEDWNRYGIYNSGGITIGVDNNTGVHHIVVRNCSVHDFPGEGIATIEADYLTIENNLVYNTAWYAMYANSGISLWHLWNSDAETKYKNFVRNNICYNNKSLVKWIVEGIYSDGNGIIIDDNKNTQATALGDPYTGRTLVENNICFNNGGSGIHAYSCSNVDIINNTAYKNGAKVGYAEIFQISSSNGYVLNNIMYAKDGGKVNQDYRNVNIVYDYNIYYNGQSARMGNNDVVADPMFISASIDPIIADFGLVEGSPAVNSGTDQIYSKTDINGIPRPQGNAVDIGAFESIFVPVSAGVIKKQESDMFIYPNPVKDILHLVANSTPHMEQFVIYDASGKIRLTASPSCLKEGYDVTSLIPGVYLLKVTTHKTSFHFKFIKL